MYIKKILTVFLVTFLFFTGMFWCNPPQTLAFSSVLGAKVIGRQEVYIDGNKVIDPKDIIVADSSQPTFSGYAVANAEVLLIINSDPFEAETLSDANGYWLYTMEIPLKAGQHALSLKITDSNNITSEETFVATFIVPEVKGEEATTPITNKEPFPKTPKVNYLTISLVVLSSLVFMGILYAFLSRKPQ